MFTWSWQGASILAGIIGAVVAYIFNLKYHKNVEKFNLVLSKFYPALESFIISANEYRDNIAKFEIRNLKPKNVKAMDETFMFPKMELKNKCFMLSLFLDEKERKPFKDIIDSADLFTLNVGLLPFSSPEAELYSQYEIVRMKFNKSFSKALDECTDMLYSKLFNKWQ